MSSRATSGDGPASGEQVVVARRRGPAGSRPTRPRSARAARPAAAQARRGSRVASMARWKVQGTPGSDSASARVVATSTREVGVEEAEGDALGAEGDVLRGQADQPHQVATGGGEGVVEAQHHPHRQRGWRGSPTRRSARRASGRRRRARAGRRRPRRSRARRGRAAPRPRAAASTHSGHGPTVGRRGRRRVDSSPSPRPRLARGAQWAGGRDGCCSMPEPGCWPT